MNKSNVPYTKISEKLGISLSTISRAFRQPHMVRSSTLQDIYKAVEELGGVLPESVSQTWGDVRILAIIPVLNNPFYTEIAQGIQNAANRNNCQLLIINEMVTPSNIQKIVHFIRQSHISGVVIMQRLEDSVLEQLKSCTTFIQCSEFNENAGTTYITIDNLNATKKLMRYILTAGRRKIALVNCDIDRFTYARIRLQGYEESLQQAGITPNPAHIITVPDGKFSVAVPAICNMLKNTDTPDAIVCVSDTMAAAALRACAMEGYHVPQDIMVTGFDNIDISVMTTPNITTINQPKQNMGYMACSQLLTMIASPQQEPHQFILDTELILRESTEF